MAKFGLQSRLSWLFVLVAHGVGAVAWVALMPRGFPFAHPRFWANVAVPIAIVVAVIVALANARRGRLSIVRAVLIGLATMWIAAAVSSRVIFPISMQLRWLAPLALGAAVTVAACAPALRQVRLPTIASGSAVLYGLTIGLDLPWF